MLYLRHHSGGLAHLARVLAWQARGDRFESGILHSKKPQYTILSDCGFFYWLNTIDLYQSIKKTKAQE